MRTAVGEPDAHVHIWRDATAGMAKPEVALGRSCDHKPAYLRREGRWRVMSARYGAVLV